MQASPNTPNCANEKRRFKLFSRKSQREKDVTKSSAVATVPPEVVPHPRAPLRSLSSPNGGGNEIIPPTLRIDTQVRRGAPSTYTSALEKFPTPSLATRRNTPLRIPTARSWQNLRTNGIENTPAVSRHRHRTVSRPRPRGLVIVGEPYPFRMYRVVDNQSTPALVSSPITRDLEENLPLNNPLPTPPSESEERIESKSSDSQPGVNLDDYPWYFVKTIGDTEFIYGLNRLAYPKEDVDKKYINCEPVGGTK